MKAVVCVVTAVALFASLASAQQVFGPCFTLSGQRGDCMAPADCKTRAGTVSGRCAGAVPKCCVRDTAVAPTAPVACTDATGTTGLCKPQSQCTTTTVSNRCPGQAANVKCCLTPTPLPANPQEAVGRTLYFTLRSQAFPGNGYPGAAVYTPRAYRNDGPLNVVVFIHGFWNCIANVVRPAGQGQACTPGAAARYPYRLNEQIESSGKNVLLVVAETARDKASGDPGVLGTRNGLRNFLHELLHEKLAPVFGARSVDSIARTIVFGHSAAYQSTSAFAVQSGVPSLRELHLLDSLYGFSDRYVQWIRAHANEFAGGAFRFTNTYYTSTATNSVAQAKAVRAAVPAAVFAWDDKPGVPSDALWATPIVFKNSHVKSHDGIPEKLVEKILAASPI